MPTTKNAALTPPRVHPWRLTANDRLSIFIRLASQAFIQALQLRLTDNNVPMGHWMFLRILWKGDGLPQREVSRRAGLMEPTTHVALKSMEGMGTIRRVRKPSDRKTVYIYLTKHGRDLQQLLDPLARRLNRAASHGINVRDLAVTRRTLLRVIDNLALDKVRWSKSRPR